MNKRKYILILGTLFIFVITGCTKEDMEEKNENVKQHSNNINNQNDALQQKLESLQDQNDQLRKQLAEYKRKSLADEREMKDYQTLRKKIVEIMNIQSFNYTVVSNKVKEKHNETVVYVEDVPKSHERKRNVFIKSFNRIFK